MEISLTPGDMPNDVSDLYHNQAIAPDIAAESKELGGSPTVDMLLNFLTYDDNNEIILTKTEEETVVGVVAPPYRL